MEYKLYQNKYPVPVTAEYVVDYIYDAPAGEPNFYYLLRRIKDDALLYANPSKIFVIEYCWEHDIPHSKVAFI